MLPVCWVRLKPNLQRQYAPRCTQVPHRLHSVHFSISKLSQTQTYFKGVLQHKPSYTLNQRLPDRDSILLSISEISETCHQSNSASLLFPLLPFIYLFFLVTDCQHNKKTCQNWSLPSGKSLNSMEYCGDQGQQLRGTLGFLAHK